jgi:hypothetical protein
MKKKVIVMLSVVASIFVISVFILGCNGYDADVDPDTLNLKNKGNGVITAYITPSDDTITKVEIGFDGEYLEGVQHSVEDGVLIVKAERKELIEILIDKGIGDDFEEYVPLTVVITTNGGSVSVGYLLRVINPENASDK